MERPYNIEEDPECNGKFNNANAYRQVHFRSGEGCAGLFGLSEFPHGFTCRRKLIPSFSISSSVPSSFRLRSGLAW